jgi:DNA-directed RNA polymerase specialized sigma subunit
MADSPRSLPTREEELILHRRLVDGDHVAPADLATTYLVPLIASLVKSNSRRVPREFIEEAAHVALMCLAKSPEKFDASQNRAALPLFAHLRRVAQRDVQNILRREKRHWRRRVSMEAVELPEFAGKYLGRNDDPSEPLQLREEAEKADGQILRFVREGLNDGERQVLELMLQGERKTAAFARVLGIEQLSKEEQKAKVKRVKDKLKKRIEREDHGRAP